MSQQIFFDAFGSLPLISCGQSKNNEPKDIAVFRGSVDDNGIILAGSRTTFALRLLVAFLVQP